MWKEILIDDIVGLQTCADIFNSVVCSDFNIRMDVDSLKRILQTKLDSHIDVYISSQFQISVVYKYNSKIDRIIIFQFNTVVDWEQPFDINEFHGIVAEYMKGVINRHGKMVRYAKYPQTVLDKEELDYIETKFRNSDITLKTQVFAQHGVNVIDTEKYWEYELM